MKRIIQSIVILACLCASPAFAAYSSIGTLTVTSNAALLPATQTNFTLLVSLSNGLLRSTANGGTITDAQGDDIVFMTSSTCASGTMSYQIETWSATAGTLLAWVLKPTLALGDVFYVCIGNSAVTSFQGGSAGAAWDSHYLSVYHTPDGTSLSFADSTAAGNNGTGVNTPTAGVGKVDGGATFASASTQYATIGSVINPAAITVSAWIKATSYANAYEVIFSRNNASAGTSYFQIMVKSTGKLAVFGKTTSVWSYDGTGAITMSSGTWYHLSASYDSSAGTAVYINATQDKLITPVGGALNTTASPSRISSDSNAATREWNGLIDELRVSDQVRSLNWTTAEYNNEADPTTFITSSFSAVSNLVTLDNLTSCASAAVAIDPTSSTLTFSMTVNAGSNKLALVPVGYRTVGKTVTSVVFNTSESFTQAEGTLANTYGADIWYLKSPTVTTANVVVTLTGGGTFVYDTSCAVVLDGVDQTTPIEAHANNTTASATSLSLSGLLSSVSNGAAVVDIISGGSAQSMTAETNRLLRMDTNASGANTASSTIISKATAGAITDQWTFGSSGATMAGVVVKPFGASASGGACGGMQGFVYKC